MDIDSPQADHSGAELDEDSDEEEYDVGFVLIKEKSVDFQCELVDWAKNMDICAILGSEMGTSELKLLRPHSWDMLFTKSVPLSTCTLTFSPDGREIAIGVEGEVIVIDVNSGKQIRKSVVASALDMTDSRISLIGWVEHLEVIDEKLNPLLADPHKVQCFFHNLPEIPVTQESWLAKKMKKQRKIRRIPRIPLSNKLNILWVVRCDKIYFMTFATNFLAVVDIGKDLRKSLCSETLEAGTISTASVPVEVLSVGLTEDLAMLTVVGKMAKSEEHYLLTYSTEIFRDRRNGLWILFTHANYIEELFKYINNTIISLKARWARSWVKLEKRLEELKIRPGVDWRQVAVHSVLFGMAREDVMKFFRAGPKHTTIEQSRTELLEVCDVIEATINDNIDRAIDEIVLRLVKLRTYARIPERYATIGMDDRQLDDLYNIATMYATKTEEFKCVIKQSKRCLNSFFDWMCHMTNKSRGSSSPVQVELPNMSYLKEALTWDIDPKSNRITTYLESFVIPPNQFNKRMEIPDPEGFDAFYRDIAPRKVLNQLSNCWEEFMKTCTSAISQKILFCGLTTVNELLVPNSAGLTVDSPSIDMISEDHLMNVLISFQHRIVIIEINIAKREKSWEEMVYETYDNNPWGTFEDEQKCHRHLNPPVPTISSRTLIFEFSRPANEYRNNKANIIIKDIKFWKPSVLVAGLCTPPEYNMKSCCALIDISRSRETDNECSPFLPLGTVDVSDVDIQLINMSQLPLYDLVGMMVKKLRVNKKRNMVLAQTSVLDLGYESTNVNRLVFLELENLLDEEAEESEFLGST